MKNIVMFNSGMHEMQKRYMCFLQENKCKFNSQHLIILVHCFMKAIVRGRRKYPRQDGKIWVLNMAFSSLN